MTDPPVRVLLVEDNPGDADLVRLLLEDAQGGPHEVTVAQRCSQAAELLGRTPIDIVLLDLGLPDSQGLDTLARIVEAGPGVPVIVLTGLADEELALDALRRRAQDFLDKDALSGSVLFRAITYATRRKEAERRVLAFEARLFEAHRMETVGRLAEGVAHDFNNLLTGILGCCGQLLDEDVRTREAAVADVREAVARATSLTEQLLCLSSSHAVDFRLLDLGDTVLHLREALSRLQGGDFRLETHVAPEGTSVRAARGQLQQVCVNLVLNAREAMPRGGRIRVEVTRLGDSWARLTVRDDGPGMSPEVRARCLEPFFTTKERGMGTGLGLTMVYTVAQQLGGTVEVESAPGQGTAVQILLPLCQETHPQAGPPFPWGAQPCPTCSGTVLVVEDESTIRKLVKRFLERRGFRVQAFDTAERALAMAQQDPPDLLVTDIVLPGMWGFELTERLRALRPDLPVLHMSGYTGEGGPPAPGVLFLSKPFVEPELVTAVCKAMNLLRPCPYAVECASGPVGASGGPAPAR